MVKSMASIIGSGGRGSHWREHLSQITQEQVVLAVTALLAIIFALALPGFASVGNLLSLLNNISILGTVALGGAIVILARGLDISQVASMAVGAGLALQLAAGGMATGWAIAAGLGAATMIGLFNGFIIAFVEMPALFATLASDLLLYGIASALITNGQLVVYVPNSTPGLLALGGAIGIVPIPILVFVGMAVIVHLFLSRTRIGQLISAHGDNPVAAREMGVSVRTLTMIEYVLSAAIAYIGGLMLMATLASVNTQIMTGSFIFDIILVAVLGGVSLVGGRGNVVCVIAGTLLIGVILNGMTLLNLNNEVQNIVRGLVLLGAIVLDNRLHPRDEETVRQGE